MSDLMVIATTDICAGRPAAGDTPTHSNVLTLEVKHNESILNYL